MFATPVKSIEKKYALTLTEQAYKKMEELIVTLQLSPGEVLSEASLTERLGIGRTPIREALHRLALEGLVVILPRRGIFVSEVNVRSQLELLRVRREIERLMVRLAAARATALEHEQFLYIADAMVKTSDTNDDVEFMRLDQELNSLVSSTCRNEYARKSMGLMRGSPGGSGTNITKRRSICRCVRACMLILLARSVAAMVMVPPRPWTNSSTISSSLLEPRFRQI